MSRARMLSLLMEFETPIGRQMAESSRQVVQRDWHERKPTGPQASHPGRG